MSSDKLLRWSGLALIVAGALSPLSIAVHPAQETVPIILGQTWRLIAGHVLGTAAIVFVLLGMVGMYLVQAEQVGRLGLAGFLLAFVGNILLATSGNYGYIAPVLAARAPELLAEVNAYGPELGLNLLMVVTYILGFILLGVASARAGVLPRWAAILLAVGIPIFFVAAGVSLSAGAANIYLIAIAGQVLFGAGLIGTGRQLWSGKRLGAGR